MTRKRILVGVAVLVTAGAAVLVFVFTGGASPQAAPATEPARTVAVVRTDLAVSQDYTGTLGFGEETPLKARTPGTVTWLPASGARIDRGGVLFKVDDRPSVLFLGDTPTYRKLDATGVKGADVKVVNQNLAALGYLSGAAGQSEVFTEASKAAVKKWQKALKLDQTGVIELADVIVLPAPIRVGAVTAQLGAATEAGLIGFTPDAKVVTLSLDAGDAGGLAVGSKVDMRLPSGATATGAVGSVAQAKKSDQGGQQKVTVTITADDPAAVAAQEGSVRVKLAATGKKGVLAVPMAALLALQEGGYGLQVVTGTGTSVVAVRTGVFAGGLVEVSGPGVDEGTKVVTAS